MTKSQLDSTSPFNIANFISLLRLLSVPWIVWFLINDMVSFAFYGTLLVSISDALDGFLARWLNCQTPLGKYLDPIADKVLLVSLYITLSFKGLLPGWLAISVVSRDFMILLGIAIAHLLGKKIHIEPVYISKVNTCFQILLVLYVLVFYFSGLEFIPLTKTGLHSLSIATLLTTLSSGVVYIIIWLKTFQQHENCQQTKNQK